MTEIAISLENVSKSYNGTPVVSDLSLEIRRGEMFGLLGPNGAGKSTTIRMLTTLTAPSSGQLQVGGYDVSRDTMAVRSCIGVVLQQISVDVDLTVWENLELHGRLHHIANPERQQRIDQWLEYVELIERRDDLVRTLSGGMKRRLQIARALLHEPEILFLDEPTVGLDPQTRRRIWEIIRDLNSRGITLLVTTHYMEEAETLCQRVGIMDAGKLIELGSPAELRIKHGEGLVVKEGGKHKFFPSLPSAVAYLDAQSDRTGMMARPSNLEDIFIELTGRRLD